MTTPQESTSLFLVRVYGILIRGNSILLSDEFHKGRSITKFPGGGLQYGEGTIEALKREFMEEMGLQIEVLSHFYTTDFFQPSAFNPKQQVISIYYKVTCSDEAIIATTEKVFDFREETDGAQSLRWKSLNDLSESDVTFPIDRHVVKLIKLIS